MDKKNHIKEHADLALEVATLIEGARDATDPGVANHLGELARSRALLLYARLELVADMVAEKYSAEEIGEIDEALDNVVPITQAGGRVA